MNKKQKGIATISLHNRGFAHFFLILALALIAVVGIGYYAYKNGQIRLTPPQDLSPSHTSQLESTANWKTYRNDMLGFEFKHPDNLKVNATSPNQIFFYEE